MRKLSVLCALSIMNSMFVSLLIVPTVSAQPDGWGTPELLELDYMGDAWYPQVAVDPNGNAIAVWEQHDGIWYNIRASRYVFGAGWMTPMLIETNDAGNAELPQVAVDAAGNAVAVWEQTNGTIYSIWANRYEVGVGWGDAELIETNDTGSAEYAQVAVDPNGNAVAVWDQNDAPYNIWANRYEVGVGWGTAELIENGSDTAYDAQVGIDSAGNAIAVWEQYDGVEFSAYANRYVVGSGWGTPELLETLDMGVNTPQVAVSPNGNAVAIWRQNNGSIFDIWANMYDVVTGWGTAELIETNDTGTADFHQVAIGADGSAVAVWLHNDGTRDNIIANRYEVGTGWGTEELIETNDVGDALYPQVAVDATGNATAVWYQWDGTRHNIWANSYVIGIGWGTEELIETNDVGDALYPQVAVDPNGNVVTIWGQDDGTLWNIWSNRYEVGVGWGMAELVEVDTEISRDHQVAVDLSGNAVAVWRQWDGTRYNVWTNRYVIGTGWETPELIQTNHSGDAYSPQIVIDASGNALVVWEQWDGPTICNIWANRYVAGIGWGVAELIETNDTGTAGNPKVAVDPMGNAMAVWAQTDGTVYNIWANRYVVGTGWGIPELIETNARNANQPDVSVDANGNAVAVWEQTDGIRLNIWANRYVVGVGWGVAELIETDDTGSAFIPQVTLDPMGNATAVWRQTNGTIYNIWANRYVIGMGWASAELIETNDTGDAYSPQVAVDPSGNAIAVWWQFDGIRYNIWSNRYDIGIGWGTAELVEANDTETTQVPKVAVDQLGNAIAVWEQFNGTRLSIWANLYKTGTGWGTPELIGTNVTGNLRNPQVDVDPFGNAMVVWQYNDGVREDIWAIRYLAPDRVPPVADAGPDENVNAGDLVIFDGSGSTDNVGIIVYYWTFDDGGLRMLLGVSPTYSFYNVGVFDVTLTVMDANGNNDTDMVVITVNPAPDTERPVADAGPDQSVVVGTPVLFDGSGSTDNVGIVNYTWTFDDSGTRTLYGVTPMYTFNNAGIFVVTLTVRDAASNSDADTVVITVNPPPDTEAPVANAGPDRNIVAGTTIVLDGSASTDNMGIVNYTWSFDDGGMQYRYTVMFAYQFSNVGVFTITLDVRDAAGNPDSDTVTVTVTATPSDTERPVANAGPDQSVPVVTLVTLDGSASTDNIGVTNYTWTFNDGGARTRYGISPTYTFNNVGVFVVTLTVKDAAGNSDSDEVVITVTPPPDMQNPVANAGPDRNIIAGTTIVLDGSASTDNVGIVNYTWNFTDGVMRYRYTAIFAYQFSNAGTIVVTLTVRDAAGNSATDTAVITVNPVTADTERPIANAGPDQSVDTGAVVTFDGSGSTDNIGVTNYTWTFDDGGARTLYGVSPTYLFNNARTFVVTLTVKDAAGNSDADVMVVVVTVPSTDTVAPVANAGPDQSIVAGSTTVLDGSASTDNVGIVNYTWTFTYDGVSRTLYGQRASFKFDTVGSRTVTLTVRDAAGNSDTDEVVITVTATPSSGEVEKEVTSPLAMAAIAIFAILMVIFALMWMMSRRKKGAGPMEETMEKEEEEEAAVEEVTEEEET